MITSLSSCFPPSKNNAITHFTYFFLFLLSARLNTWTEISTTSSLLCRLCVYKTWKPVFTSFVILNTLSILWTGLKNKRIYNSVAHHNFFSHRRIFFLPDSKAYHKGLFGKDVLPKKDIHQAHHHYHQ